MKLAAVLDVGHGTAALKYAIDAQLLLLERLGSKLDSIRLAAPRLHRHACTSAIAENIKEKLRAEHATLSPLRLTTKLATLRRQLFIMQSRHGDKKFRNLPR